MSEDFDVEAARRHFDSQQERETIMSFTDHEITSIPAEKRATPVLTSAEALDRVRSGLAVAEDKAVLGNVKGADGVLRVVRSYQSLATTLAKRENDEMRDYCTTLLEMDQSELRAESIVASLALILGIDE